MYEENDNQSSNTYESQNSSEQNLHKRYRPNSTDGDSDPYISDLSEILENASSYPESLKKITTLILSNTAIKIQSQNHWYQNLISWKKGYLNSIRELMIAYNILGKIVSSFQGYLNQLREKKTQIKFSSVWSINTYWLVLVNKTCIESLSATPIA